MLYKVIELSDLFVDACLRNESGELMFLSVYGRDTAIQQFRATMQLKPNSGGISSFTLKACDSSSEARHTIQVGNPDRFAVYSGRFPKENLFGNLTQLWIYDPVLIKPDKSTKVGWVMLDQPWGSNEVKDKLLSSVWGLYKTLSPVPLLDEWQSAVMHHNNEICVTWMTATNYPPLGNICAAKLMIDSEFTSIISSMVKTGQIGIDGQRADPDLINPRSIVMAEKVQDIDGHQAKAMLKPFLSQSQYSAMIEYCKGEEGDFFESKFKEMAMRIKKMPKTYEQSNQSDPLVSLHYFYGGSDWYIIEKDKTDGVSQAFGYAILNGDLMFAELGYISISELTEMGVDFDLYFEPTHLSVIKEVLKRKYGAAA